jgi:hypothetical protein
LTSKTNSKSQFEDSDLSNIHVDDTFSDSQHTSVSNRHSNNQLNDRKNGINPASYYNAIPPPFEESEKQKVCKSQLMKIFFKKFNFYLCKFLNTRIVTQEIKSDFLKI